MVEKLYIDALTEAEIAKIEAKLRPGQSSKAGFLGPNESLKEVIYQDAETLRRLGVTHEQVADKLEAVITQNISGFEIQDHSYRGGQEDPFQEKWNWPPYSSFDYVVTNSDGKSIKFPGLIIKLIRDYQFFEGKGIPYRVDPETVVKFLKLK